MIEREPILLSVWEKSLVKQCLNDDIEECINAVEHYKGQKFIKEEKGQMDRVKDYERQIAETTQLRLNLQDLVKRFE